MIIFITDNKLFLEREKDYCSHLIKKSRRSITSENMENIFKRFLSSNVSSDNEKAETKASPQSNLGTKMMPNNSVMTTPQNPRNGMKRQTSIDQDQNFYLM